MRTKIYFENNQEKEVISYRLKMLIRRSVEAALAYEEIDDDCEVSVTFVDNEEIREINRKFRNIDRATDVLSFPLFDEDGMDAHVEELDCMLGDIVLSLERAREQAAEFGHSFAREVAFLTVHSVLHLLGYDHELSDEDDADMRKRQTEIVENMGLSVNK
ncbi:MAG: rRNA maturation RNase YbeY [Clostridia bacterium]|nr:rRNA maturation RNase YbeY [Clostridia bacterium]